MQWSERIGRRIKLRDLHILTEVVQSGSMSKAAKSLAVSTPVVGRGGVYAAGTGGGGGGGAYILGDSGTGGGATGIGGAVCAPSASGWLTRWPFTSSVKKPAPAGISNSR